MYKSARLETPKVAKNIEITHMRYCPCIGQCTYNSNHKTYSGQQSPYPR